MSGVLYLAWRYAARHRAKTAILVAAIGLIVFLPIGLQVLVGESAEQLRSRARSTPLLVGAKGSALELTLSSLYFESRTPEPTRFAEVARVRDSGLAQAIPLHARFRVRSFPIVGTTLDYLDFRGLELERGRRMATLGECLLGSAAARALDAAPGDLVVSSPESVLDLAGVYPLRMRVVGVLAPAHTPDDRAVFVDLKTAWVIEGLGHGHQDLAQPAAEAAVLSREGAAVTANASLVEYAEITAENSASFHFHGDLSEYPLSAVIALPLDERARALLMGRYGAPDGRVQVLRPIRVMDALLETVLTVQSYVVAAIAIVAAATLMTAALVFMLSLQLRRREIETLVKIGGARASVGGVLASEVVVVLVLGASLAAALTLATSQLGSSAIRALLLS